MRSVSCLLVVALSYVGLNAECVGQQNSSTPKIDDLLQGYRNATTWSASVSLEVSSQSNNIGFNEGTAHYAIKHSRRGDLAEWFQEISVDVDGTTKRTGDVHIFGESLSVIASKDTSESVYLGEIRHARDEHQFGLDIADPPKGNFLDGLFDGTTNQPLSSILESANTAGNVRLRPAKEKVGDFDCYVLDAVSDFGNIEVWLSPDQGFNALQYKVRATGNQLYGDTPVAELGIDECVLTITDIEMTVVDGVFVPKSGTYRKQVRMKDGSATGSVVHSERDKIELAPDFAASGAFTPRLPDGSLVYDDQFPGIAYAFMGGKMLPAIDKRALDSIEKTLEGLSPEQAGVHGQAPETSAQSPAEEGGIADPAGNKNSPMGVYTALALGLCIALGGIAWLITRRASGEKTEP